MKTQFQTVVYKGGEPFFSTNSLVDVAHAVHVYEDLLAAFPAQCEYRIVLRVSLNDGARTVDIEDRNKIIRVRTKEGRCSYITPWKEYVGIVIDYDDVVLITDDVGEVIWIYLPACPHIGNLSWEVLQ